MKVNENETAKAVETIKLDSFEIKQAFKNKKDNGDIDNYLFNAVINGISFYQMRMRQSKGEWFIAYPSRKANDGNYYNYYFIPFDPEDADKIMAEVIAKAQ